MLYCLCTQAIGACVLPNSVKGLLESENWHSNIYWFVLHLFFGSGFHYRSFSHLSPNQLLSLTCHVKLVLAKREKQNTVEVAGAKDYLDNLTSLCLVQLFLL